MLIKRLIYKNSENSSLVRVLTKLPDGVSIKTWKGNAARQQVSEVGSNYHLPGGDEQLFISFIKGQDPSFVDKVIKTKAQW